VDFSGDLEEEEVWKCLTVCGMLRSNGLSREGLGPLMQKAKRVTEEQQTIILGREPSPEFVDVDAQGTKDTNEAEDAKPVAPSVRFSLSVEIAAASEPSESSDDIGEFGADPLSFPEFLTLMTMVRSINREANQVELHRLFNKYDVDKTGHICVKEILRLLASLELKPKTREEQFEIQMILDQADENGDGGYGFREFEFLVHRVQEHLDRLTRRKEEAYAEEIGMPIKRCRELRDVFRNALVSCCLSISDNILDVAGLRHAMENLHLRYSSEELLHLYSIFGRQESSQEEGGFDGEDFLKLMHAIEIAKTHGQVNQWSESTQTPTAAALQRRRMSMSVVGRMMQG